MVDDVKDIQESSDLEQIDVNKELTESSADEEIDENLDTHEEEVEETDSEPSDEVKAHEESIPYDRFKEVNEKNKELEARLAELEQAKIPVPEPVQVEDEVTTLLESDSYMQNYLQEQIDLYDMEVNTDAERILQQNALRRVEMDINARKRQLEDYVQSNRTLQMQKAEKDREIYQEFIKSKNLDGDALSAFNKAIENEAKNPNSKLLNYEVQDALDIIWLRNQDKIPKGKVVKTTTENPKRQLIANSLESKGSPDEVPDSEKSLRQIIAESLKEPDDDIKAR